MFQEAYEIAVREDAEQGTSLLNVRAYDADTGKNAKITYTFSRETNSKSKALFDINSDTGIITIASEYIIYVINIHT